MDNPNKAMQNPERPATPASQEPVKMKVTCGNPECGKSLTFKKPAKAGRYSINCPHCSQKIMFAVNADGSVGTGSPVAKKQAADSGAQMQMGLQPDGSYRLSCSTCGQKLLLKKDSIRMGHNAVTCPKCSTRNEFDVEPSEDMILACKESGCNGKAIKPSEADGFYNTHCDTCGQSYKIIIKGGKVVECNQPTSVFKPHGGVSKMMLTTGGGLFKKKRVYVLSEGSHMIGRNDVERQSDFAIDDPTMSRRSVRIDVTNAGAGFLYKMTVVSCTNPVYHNQMWLSNGEQIYLGEGDIILMGKTKIKVQKV